ncbi:MAG: hypothetical protein GY909_02365 [Oligoflexia bacterium]|nr:hypothetical protein [Oligoflexia bacterium]
MSLVNKLFPKLKKSNGLEILKKNFMASSKQPDFPFYLAKETLKRLEETAETDESFFLYMLEDSVFSSIYATFYEHLIQSLKSNPKLAIELIDNWERGSAEREQIIGEQTQYHMNYIVNGGVCPGCPCCENHADVGELVGYYQNQDILFIENLYLGMQTIQFAMEQLIYDLVPESPEILNDIQLEDVLKYRQFIFDYSEKNKD